MTFVFILLDSSEDLVKHFSLGLKKLDFVFNDLAELWSGTLKLLGVLVFLPLGFIWLLGSFGMIPKE